MAVRKKYASSVLGRGLDEIGNGRGLDALIDTTEVKTEGSSNLNEIAISQIEPNPNQPRREFDPATLQDLATSIRELGIVQPITLRQTGEDKYQIVAGERRWRASQLVGLKAIPAYIRTIDDDSAMQMALVENIQRDDLNAIEIALAYAHLLEQDGMTQEKVSERVGKSRVAVANYLRLLKLPAQVQMALQKHEIDMGHARALLSLDSPSQQIKVFREIQKNGSSVRQVEEIVKKLKSGESVSLGGKKLSSKNPMSEEIKLLREQLSNFLQTKVSLNISPSGKGKISIPFTNEEELEHIMSVFDHLKRQ